MNRSIFISSLKYITIKESSKVIGLASWIRNIVLLNNIDLVDSFIDVDKETIRFVIKNLNSKNHCSRLYCQESSTFDIDIIKLLIEKDSKYFDYHFATLRAITENNSEVFDLVIDLSEYNYEYMDLACKSGNLHAVKAMLPLTGTHHKNEFLLIDAVKAGNYDIIKLLIENKVFISVSCLEISVLAKRLDLVSLILEHGQFYMISYSIDHLVKFIIDNDLFEIMKKMLDYFHEEIYDLYNSIEYSAIVNNYRMFKLLLLNKEQITDNIRVIVATNRNIEMMKLI